MGQSKSRKLVQYFLWRKTHFQRVHKFNVTQNLKVTNKTTRTHSQIQNKKDIYEISLLLMSWIKWLNKTITIKKWMVLRTTNYLRPSMVISNSFISWSHTHRQSNRHMTLVCYLFRHSNTSQTLSQKKRDEDVSAIQA